MTGTGDDRRRGARRSRPSGPSAATTAAICALVAVAQGVGAVTWWPVHATAEFVLLAVAAVVVGTMLAVAGARWHWSAAVVALSTLAAFLVLGVPLAVPGRALAGVLPTPQGLLDLLAGTALGWKQLLTVSLPVGSYQALLVPVFVLLLVGTVVGATVALRTRRGELGVLPAVVTWTAGLVLGPSEAFLPLVTGVGLVVVLVAWTTWWRLHRRRVALDALTGAPQASAGRGRGTGHSAAALRATAGAAGTVLLAGAVAVGAVLVAPPAAPRLVARDAVEQPFDPRDQVSPLTRFREYQKEPVVDRELFTVSGLPDGALVRLATMDTWDGVSWTVGSADVESESGTFERVPVGVDQSDTVGVPVTVDVELGDWSSVWVPTVGQLERIDFTGGDAADLRDGFAYNDATGTAAVLGGLSGGDAYRLDAVLPSTPDEGDLEGATPGPATVPAPRDVPEQVRQAVRDAVTAAGAESPGERLVAVLAALRRDGYVSHGVGADEPVSRSGHGADRVAQLFDDPVMIGDAEQYATAAALLADEVGFPARVVMGFDPTLGDPADAAAGVVRGSAVTAWIEVDTAGAGWVAIDPNPEERPVPEDLVQDPTQVSRPESVVQPPPQEPQLRDQQSPPQTDRETPEEQPAWLAVLLAVLRVTGTVLLVLAVLAAPFLGVVAAKARRRRRRRARPDTADRIAGGWQEFEDAVRDVGIPLPVSGTRHEIATTVGGQRPVVLARIADRAVFSPDVPPVEDADRVWTAVLEMRRSLTAPLTRWQRVKAAVSLRSLRVYDGAKRPRR